MLFLLKNYQRLKSEIMFLSIEKKEREMFSPPQLTGCLSQILSGSYQRFKDLDYDMLNKAARIIECELADLEAAVETLSNPERGIMKDIYFNRVSWVNVTQKWHVSESTISRYRKKCLISIWQYMTRGISTESEGVIEWVNKRKTSQKINSQ